MHGHGHRGPLGDLLLDIGDGVGALVIHTPAYLFEREIEVSPLGADSRRVHTVVRRFEGRGRASFAAVFPELAEGEYRIWTDDPDLPTVASIQSGEVTEVDWSAPEEGSAAAPPSP
ncbi:MAG TPA: phospholipase [Candidatus Dormibacteraeota bacterium]